MSDIKQWVIVARATNPRGQVKTDVYGANTRDEARAIKKDLEHRFANVDAQVAQVQ